MIEKRRVGSLRLLLAAAALLMTLPPSQLQAGNASRLTGRYASLPSDPEVFRTRTRALARGNGAHAPGAAPASVLVRTWAPMECLPGGLATILADVARRYGGISVESTRRTPGHNRRVGGADQSLHLACRAMDLRVRAGTGSVVAYLRSHPGVGGLKVYRNGIIHVDDGLRRSW